MHLIFMLLLILLIILVIIFTVLIYNELIRLRNGVIKNWHIISDLIDEYVFNSKTANKEEYNKLIAVDDIINYYYKVKDEDNEISDKIVKAKRIYNDYVLALNNKIMLFPFNIVASIFSFSKWPYFRD